MKKYMKVAMKATKNQFENDLKQGLSTLECRDLTSGNWDVFDYISLNKEGKCIGNYQLYNIDKENYDFVLVDHYNPKLFLALAAMSDKEDGVIGEYWKMNDVSGQTYSFTLNKLYKQVNNSILNIGAFIDNKGSANGFFGDNHNYFVKATKEEIIEALSTKEKIVEDKKFNVGDEVRVTNNCRWRAAESPSADWHSKGYKAHFGSGRETQFIYRIEGDLVFIDNKSYKYENYIVVERKNIELVNKNTIKMKNRILTPENAQRIIAIACSTWKPKLAEKWATNIVLSKNTEISEEFYKDMREACTSDQHKLFDEIFGKDENLIQVEDLKMGEAMIVVDSGHWNGTIIMKTFAGFVNVYNPNETWNSPIFEGKRVKLTITHEVID